MPTCFVIQPFDSGPFDKRFEQVYKPAIVSAGLEPYRVDQDAGSVVPIDSIESGIRAATICLADITTDNPNVWYELGYAFAAKRPIVMVCAQERQGKKYPFDIQHRTVISYTADAPGDFTLLERKITDRIKALVVKGQALQEIAENDQVAPLAGLTQTELTVLVAIASDLVTDDGKTGVRAAQQNAEKAGLNKMGFALGLRRLKNKSFVSPTVDEDQNGYQFDALELTPSAWDWIEANEEKFVLKREPARSSYAPVSDDDIPF